MLNFYSLNSIIQDFNLIKIALVNKNLELDDLPYWVTISYESKRITITPPSVEFLQQV